jgi:hypothetical protein
MEHPGTKNRAGHTDIKVDIPMSEVRSLPPPTDKKKVFWVAGAPIEATVRFVIFIAPTLEHDPAPPDTDTRRHLFSLRFRSGRWMVVFVEIASLSPIDLSSARRAIIGQFLPNSHGHALADLRSVLFSQPSGPEPGCNGFIELCLDEA